MTPTDYLNLSADEQRKFFCEACGIEAKSYQPKSGGRIGWTNDHEFARRHPELVIPSYPNLTLDFLFEWARKANIAIRAGVYTTGMCSGEAMGKYECHVQEDESPQLAIQIAILKKKGVLG